jgi:hypothetical protein
LYTRSLVAVDDALIARGGPLDPALRALLAWEAECERECPVEWTGMLQYPPHHDCGIADPGLLSPRPAPPRSPGRSRRRSRSPRPEAPREASREAPAGPRGSLISCGGYSGPTGRGGLTTLTGQSPQASSPQGHLARLAREAHHLHRSPSDMSVTGGAVGFCLKSQGEGVRQTHK